MGKRQAEPVIELGAEAARLIALADRAAASIVAGQPSKRLFDQWRVIGRALWTARTAIAERHGGRAGHLGAPWRRWLAQHPGLSALKASERSHAVWLCEHEAAVTAWRDGLPPKQRDRTHHPATVFLGYRRHLREQQIIGALQVRREDARRAADRQAKILADLSIRFVALETEVVTLRNRVAALEGVALGAVVAKPAEASRGAARAA